MKTTAMSRVLARLNATPSIGRRDRGEVSGAPHRRSPARVLGTGAAVIAVIAVLTATGPDDSGALINGPQQPVSPTEIIRYGG